MGYLNYDYTYQLTMLKYARQWLVYITVERYTINSLTKLTKISANFNIWTNNPKMIISCKGKKFLGLLIYFKNIPSNLLNKLPNLEHLK